MIYYFLRDITHAEMHLSTDTVNELGSTAVDTLDQADHSLNLGVVRVEVVVVNVQLIEGVLERKYMVR